jgi:glutathione S-transferase
MLKLHCAPGTISVVAAMTLTEAGLDWQPVMVDFKSAAQTKPAYLAINPKGRVPTLETPDGLLTETGAILEYVGALAPDAHLIPADPFKTGKMREVMYYLASTMHPAHAHKMRGHRWATEQASFDDMRANVPRTATECCIYLEHNVAFGPFVLGDQVCLADPYLYMITRWLAGDGVTIADYPKLAAFSAAFAARPSVGSVREMGLL